MDLRKIKKLIELLEESDLAEMEIREGEESIRLSRSTSIAQAAAYAQAPAMMAPPVAAQAPVAPAAAAAPEPAPAAPTGHSITSPMVGTFYASPDPDSPAFASVGSSVKTGDTLCIIEAMKTFNPIEADRAGVIKAAHKQNGDPVEFGEVLFVIE